MSNSLPSAPAAAIPGCEAHLALLTELQETAFSGVAQLIELNPGSVHDGADLVDTLHADFRRCLQAQLAEINQQLGALTCAVTAAAGEHDASIAFLNQTMLDANACYLQARETIGKSE